MANWLDCFFHVRNAGDRYIVAYISSHIIRISVVPSVPAIPPVVPGGTSTKIDIGAYAVVAHWLQTDMDKVKRTHCVQVTLATDGPQRHSICLSGTPGAVANARNDVKTLLDRVRRCTIFLPVGHKSGYLSRNLGKIGDLVSSGSGRVLTTVHMSYKFNRHLMVTTDEAMTEGRTRVQVSSSQIFSRLPHELPHLTGQVVAVAQLADTVLRRQGDFWTLMTDGSDGDSSLTRACKLGEISTCVQKLMPAASALNLVGFLVILAPNVTVYDKIRTLMRDFQKTNNQSNSMDLSGVIPREVMAPNQEFSVRLTGSGARVTVKCSNFANQRCHILVLPAWHVHTMAHMNKVAGRLFVERCRATESHRSVKNVSVKDLSMWISGAVIVLENPLGWSFAMDEITRMASQVSQGAVRVVIPGISEGIWPFIMFVPSYITI